MSIIPAAKKAVVGAVAVGALSLGAAGVAGAATAGTTTPTPSTRLASFNCANAAKVLGRIQMVEGDIAAGLPKLTAAQAKAAAAGHTKLADRLAKRITRLKGATFTNRLDKAASAVEAKCNVPAPSGTAS